MRDNRRIRTTDITRERRDDNESDNPNDLKQFQELFNLKVYYHKYKLEVGKYPNYGIRLTKDFKNWLKKEISSIKEDKKERFDGIALFLTIEKINKSNQIKELIISKIKNSNLSLKKISDSIQEIGINATVTTIIRIALRDVYKSNQQEYNIRFPKPKNRVTPEIKAKVLKELQKDNAAPLNVIGREYNIGETTVREWAHELYKKRPHEYRKRWPYLNEIIDNKKLGVILQFIDDTDLTLTDIGIKCDVARNTVGNIAKNEIYKENIKGYMNRFPQDVNNTLGIELHSCISYILTKFFEKRGVKYFTDVRIFPNSKKNADGLILNDNDWIRENLLDLFNLAIINETKAVQIDYTSDLTERNILRKIEKYQDKDLLLVIVGTNNNYFKNKKYIDLPNESYVKFPQNIKIIDCDLFNTTIKLIGEYQKIFLNAVDLASNRKLEALIELSEKIFYPVYFTLDLREYLITNNFIEEDINEYFEINI